MADLHVDTPQLRNYGRYLDVEISRDLEEAIKQATTQGCNTAGFRGVLSPLKTAMHELSGLATQTGHKGQERLSSTVSGVYATANSYDHVELDNHQKFTSIALRTSAEFDAGEKGKGTAAPGRFTDKKEISSKEIAPDDGHLVDEIAEGNILAESVDWFFRQFVSKLINKPGEGMFDLLLTPIAGDFNRIKANGAAWTDVSAMFRGIAQNMGDNVSELKENYWTSGKAADGFQNHIDVAWTGGLAGASVVAAALKKGFDKLSELSVKIAKVCVKLIGKALKAILKLVKRVIPKGFPGANLLFDAIEWGAHGFSPDKIPYYSEVVAIIDLIKHVIALHRAIEKIVTGMHRYVMIAHKMVNSFKQIPHIESNAGAINVATDLGQSAKEAKENTTGIKESAKEASRQTKEWDKSVEKATKAS